MTMGAPPCPTAREPTLPRGRSGVLGSDRRSRFRSADFASALARAVVRIRMDGRGRVSDTIFVERLYQSLGYLRPCRSLPDLE